MKTQDKKNNKKRQESSRNTDIQLFINKKRD